MSIPSIREFTGRQTGPATALACLAAALEAKARGTALQPAMATGFKALFAALGAGNLLDGVDALTVEEAKALAPEVRQNLRFDGLLMNPDTHTGSWSYADPAVLQDVGAFSRSHATVLSKNIVPALEGLSARLAAPGASFLDIGVGVAGTACAMAEQWPNLRIVGIDVWQPSLALARENVAKAGLGDRIELRERGAESLEDDKVFDLAWMPIPFLPARVLEGAMQQTHHALRPGGWLIVPFINVDGLDPVPAALWRLRQAMFGGSLLTTTAVEDLLKARGYTDVHPLPRHPGVPTTFAVGRRKPA